MFILQGLAARGIQQAGVNVRRNIDKYNVIDGADINNDAPVDIERSRGVSNDNAENTEDNYQSLRTSSISSGSKEHSSMSPRASPSPRNSQSSSRTNSIPLVTGKISDISSLSVKAVVASWYFARRSTAVDTIASVTEGWRVAWWGRGGSRGE